MTISTTTEATCLNDIGAAWTIVATQPHETWHWLIDDDNELTTFRRLAFRAHVSEQPHYSVCTGKRGAVYLLYARVWPTRWRRK